MFRINSSVTCRTSLALTELPATVWKGGFYSKLRRQLVSAIVWLLIFMVFCVEFGPPVKCILHYEEYERALQDQLDNLCWTERLYNKNQYPDVPFVNEESQSQGKKKETLYNWITPLFWIQCLIAMTPYVMWSMADTNGALSLAQDLNIYCMEAFEKQRNGNGNSEDEEEEEVESYTPDKVARFLVEGFRRKCSPGYVQWYFLIEMAGWIFTGFSIAGMDVISNFSFSGEGMDVFYHLMVPDLASRKDELAQKFPVFVECNVTKFGHGGGIDDRATTCVLPGNFIVSRCFILLWIIQLLLLITDTMNLIYRLTCFVSKRFRYMLICESAWKVDHIKVRRVNDKLDFSTWFLLYEIGMNCNVSVFAMLIDGMDNELYVNDTDEGDEWHDTEVKHTFRNSM